jgi:hypothetical protein
MSTINSESTLVEVAAIISHALTEAGIAATLSGGAVVSLYSNNKYQSKDLDFVTAASVAELSPVLECLGFVHIGTPRFSQFAHPGIRWFVEFPPTPISFGNLYVRHEDCSMIETEAGRLQIITPTQSVMDRLAAAIAWNDAQSREQAVLVARNQAIDWDALREWFSNEGESTDEYERFRSLVGLATILQRQK